MAIGKVRVLLASSNGGKLGELRELASGSKIEMDLIPGFARLPRFDETAPTFAENAAGKALHYSRFTEEIVLADDSGITVPALGGTPGVLSARYAGPNASDAARNAKLLREMEGKTGPQRAAAFICAMAAARAGRALAIASGRADGLLLEAPRGASGFGYDPIFLFPPLGRTFAELAREEKNQHSHRGQAFRNLARALASPSDIPVF